MADLKDIIAKREELMKAGNTNYTDAMAEARRQVTTSQAPTTPTPAPIAPQPIQPAPVTPQVVPPQPIQPAPLPTQPTDWMGDFSQIKKREPVAPTAVTPEPVAPAPVTPTTPKTVKPEVPVVNRQQEIQNNLATGYQTNPGLFTDRAAYDKAYNYATKTPEEQATLDSFYNSKQPTISSMYSAIVNKQEVPDSTKMTPAYKIAQNRYSKASSFSSMTPSQVSDQMRSAKLVEGSQAFEDLKSINPKLVQDATNLRKVNGDTTNIWTTNTDGTKVNNLEKSIADDYTDNFGEFIKSMYKVYTPAEITAIIRTPDVVAAEDKAFAIEKSINELDKQMANIDKEVDTEFKGSGATGSRLAMEKASRRDVLNKDRDSQVREYTTYANRASNLITQNTTSFQTQQQQQQAQNAAMLPFIQDQYKTAQAKKQSEFELNDPKTQIEATMDEFAKLGIVAQGNTASKIAEFNKSGLSLPAYITQLRGQFMSKPEYKKIQSLQQGQLSDVEKMDLNQKFDLQKLAQQNNFDMKKLEAQLEASGWTKDASGNLVNPVTGQTFSGSNNETFSGDTTSYIASKEGFRDKAYQDSAGVWTIGYGTTRINGKPIQPGQTITQAEAQKILGQDIAKHSTWKTLIDPNTLSQAQQTALASFEYNLGPGIWNKSAMNILDMVKSGNIKGAADEMKKYNRAGGNVIKGLQNRRNEEANLLMNTSSGTKTTDQGAEAMALVQGLGGTEGERASFAKNIIDRANKKNISLLDAKKELGYKSLDDKNFEETRKQQYTDMRKSYSESTGNAKTALTLLNEPQTAIGDVASVVGFLKTIDPASVARESEVEAVENARGIIDGLSNVFQKAKEGTKLTTEQRNQLKGAIETIVKAQDNKFYESVRDISNEFNTRGLDASVYIPKTYIEKANNLQDKKSINTVSSKEDFLSAIANISSSLKNSLSGIK